MNTNLNFGVVVIGRNEGERLKRCLLSVPAAAVSVYVDSGSTDGSVQWARENGARVVELDKAIPFTAARARNAGFRRLREVSPTLIYVQFVDGDCELDSAWLEKAALFLGSQPDVSVVCGQLIEREPERSIYNWLCDREWDRPAGETRSCGGNAMIRINAFEMVGGFREDLVAGEEPELCVRARSAGGRVFRLADRMAFHDAAMTHFGQWWRRTLRSGYAYAQGAYLHRTSTERHYSWESCRAMVWGLCLPLICVAIAIAFSPWGWASFLIYPLQLLRQIVRNVGPLRDRTILACFQLLARFAESWGQLKFLRDRALKRNSRLVEYK